MNDQILVEIYVPIVQMTFDVYLPVTATLNQCMEACLEYLTVLTTLDIHCLLFYHQQQDQLLSTELLVKDSGLHIGSNIILM